MASPKIGWHWRSCTATAQSPQRHGRHTQSPSRAVPHGTQLRMLRRCCGRSDCTTPGRCLASTRPKLGAAWAIIQATAESGSGPHSKEAHDQSRLCVTRSWRDPFVHQSAWTTSNRPVTGALCCGMCSDLRYVSCYVTLEQCAPRCAKEGACGNALSRCVVSQRLTCFLQCKLLTADQHHMSPPHKHRSGVLVCRAAAHTRGHCRLSIPLES